MIALDASVLIAHLNPVDSHHAVATELLLSNLSESFVIHPITMAEILVGAARFGREAQMHGDLLAMGIQVAPRDDEEPLRLARLRATTKLKLPDCCILDTAMAAGTALATFDRALAEAAVAHRIPVLPAS